MSHLSTRQMRRAWSRWRCNGKDYKTITFLGRRPVKIISFCEDAWKAAEMALIASGYPPAKIVGSYNCRRIAGSTGYSLHSYRVALDIDPALNFRERVLHWGRHKLTRTQANRLEAIRTVNGKQVFYAGWRFRHHDPMHFQLACSPADIMTGINWGTVKGYSSKPGRSQLVYVHHGLTVATANHHTLKLTKPFTHSDEVELLQEELTQLGFRLRADGVFGPATKRMVIRFQRAKHLTADGIVGKRTWGALET